MTTASQSYDILGIGHALLDAFVAVTSADLERLGLARGAMTPVTPETANRLASSAHAFAPGGSMANSLAVAAAIGARTSFICSVADDAAGRLFVDGMTESGVALLAAPAEDLHTGLSIIHIDDEAERTMATSLGCAGEIRPEDVFAGHLGKAAILAFDGYLLDNPHTRALALAAIVDAKASPHPPLIATSLGDAGCARRNARLFDYLAQAVLVDAVFANEAEILAMTGAPGLAYALASLCKSPADFYLTRGAHGVAIAGSGFHETLPAAKIERLVDTTGAGDAFAGGVLYALSRDVGRTEAAEVGLAAAAEIIQQIGARPQRPLRHLADLVEDSFDETVPNVA